VLRGSDSRDRESTGISSESSLADGVQREACMSSSHRHIVAAITALALVASPCAAFAQEYGAPLRLESDTPHTEYKVYAGKKTSAPWFECAAPCTATVPLGEYRIEASGPEMSRGKTVTTVVGDTRVTTRGGSSDAKTAGLVVGIAGSAVALVGLIGVAVNSCFLGGSLECSDHDHPEAREAFGVVLAVGAASTIVGWVMFGSNRTKVVAEPTYAPRIVSVGVGPAGGGVALGALGTF
jgi:hypothetical protein